MQKLWNVLIFNVWLPKGQHKNVRENKGHWPFNSPGSHFSLIKEGNNNGGRCNNKGYHNTTLPDQKQLSVIRAHTPMIFRGESSVLGAYSIEKLKDRSSCFKM